MTKLSNITTDFDITKARLVNELNSNSEAFQVLSPAATSNALVNMLAGISALWNHKIEQAELNLFMDSAYGQQSVYALAKTKGYTPANKIPARCSARLDLSNRTTIASLPIGSVFIIGDYQYYTKKAYNASASDTYLDIELTQGTNIKESFTTTGTAFDYFDFSSNFSLTEGSVSATIDGVQWTNNGTSLFGTTSLDKVYIVNNNSDGTSTLIFGNDVFGMIPPNRSSLVISYYQNVGSLANSTSAGLTVSSVDNQYNGVTTSAISGGKEEQDSDSIKYTANKLAATDDQKVLITRKNFNGYLYRQYDILDGKAWGAYEQTLKTEPDVTQMNKVWFTVVPPDITPRVNTIGNAEASTTQSGTIPSDSTPILPGSTVITVGETKLSEASGGIGVLCEDDTSITYSSGTAYSNVGSNPEYMFDENLNNYYDAGQTPFETDPVIVGLTFNTASSIKALRIRSIATQDITNIASPKSIKFYGTTSDTPDFTSDTDWFILNNIEDLGLILSNTWSRWIGFSSNETLTAIKLVITSSLTPGLKISEIQLQNDSQVSTINYETGNFVLKLQNAATSSDSIVTSNVVDSSTLQYVKTIEEDLTSKTLFTTVFSYEKPVVRTIDIYMNLYYSSSYDGVTVVNNVKAALQALFKIPTKMLGSKLTLSDLYYTVRSIEGVTNVDIISPTYNSIMDTNEFPVLNSLTINTEIYND